VWLLQECKDLDYSIEVYKRGSDMLAPASLKKVHPLGKSPTITVEAPGQAQPLVLAESAAIFEYLSEYFAPQLIPTRYKAGQEGKIGGETEEWIRYRFYMHYAEGSLMSILLIQYLMDRRSCHSPSSHVVVQTANPSTELKTGSQVPFFVKPITRAVATKIEEAFLNNNLKTQFSFLESQIASSPDQGKYICGKNLTAADILLSFPLLSAKSRIPATDCPKLHAYITRIEQHPGYVSSIKKIEEVSGEPFQVSLRQ
jgi:glutathione S-transferase